VKLPRGARPSSRRRAPLGGRATRQLEATRNALCSTSEHPTAERVFRLVRSEFPRVSRGTVYRNLQKLVDAGEALQLQLGRRSARFDGRVDDHDHFVCVECGAVLDVDVAQHRVHRPWAAALGYEIERVAVTYHGRCAACAHSAAAARERTQASNRR
jgi:Fur family transcriptional regulator, peroxide stress response regulator